MAILRGEEARQWLAQNPNKAYKNLTTNVSVPRQQSGLEKFFMNISKPIRTFVPAAQELGYTISDLVRMGRGEGPTERPDSYFGMTEEESESFRSDPLKQGVKAGSALMAYGVPAGGGQAASTLGRIGTAAGRGAISGTMSGFGYSDEGEELSGTLSGGALGGILGGALQGVGELSRAKTLSKQAEQLAKKADDFEVNSYTKKIGSKPTMGQGKYELARDSLGLAKAEKYTINNADDLYAFSDELFNKYGGVASEYAGRLDDMGQMIPIAEVKRPLLEKLATTKTPELKAPIERVLSSIDEAAGGNAISVSDLLSLRKEWGNLGNWNQFTPASEKAVASAWEEVYRNSNNILDDVFKGAGITDFRDVNKVLKTAIEQQNWARRAKAASSAAPVWTDMAQDATMFATAVGGGPGSIVGFLGSKGLQRYGEDIASGVTRGASKALSGTSALSSIVPPVANVAQRAVPGIVGAGQAMPQRQEPQLEGLGSILPPQEQGPQIDEMALINAVLSGQISTSEADWLMRMLGGSDGKPVKQTETQRDYDMAADALTQAYQALEEGGAGKLATVGGNIAGFFGATSPSSAYRAQLDTATAFLRKALIGAGQSEAELKNLNLPKPTDEPAIAKQKIEALIPLLRDRAGGSINTGDTSSTALSSIMPWIAQ